jgi:hypothetical protein
MREVEEGKRAQRIKPILVEWLCGVGVKGWRKTLSQHLEEFCGDSRHRLSGRASGRFCPLHWKFNAEITYIASRERNDFQGSGAGKKKSPFGRRTAEGGCPHIVSMVHIRGRYSPEARELG